MVSRDKRKKGHDDPGSSWGYGGVARRDFRASPDGPEVIPHRSKKKKNPTHCHKSDDHEHRLITLKPNSWRKKTVYECYMCYARFNESKVLKYDLKFAPNWVQQRVDLDLWW